MPDPEHLSADRWAEKISAAAGRGDQIVAYDRCAEAIRAYPEEPRLRYLQILTLVNAGSTGRARDAYHTWFTGSGPFADIPMGNLRSRLHRDVAVLPGRIEKDEAVAGGDVRGFARAARRYEYVYHRSDHHYYPGINAASLWYLAGRRDRARQIAQDVLARCAQLGAAHANAAAPPNPDVFGVDDFEARRRYASWEEERYYIAATEAEANLLLDAEVSFEQALRETRSRGGRDWGRLGQTHRQLMLVAKYQGRDEADARTLLSPLGLPRVVHYCGHIFRENEPQEDALRKQIEDYLDEKPVGYGHGGLAAGADILFAETLLSRGAEVRVVLPFQMEEYIRTSVAPFGESWVPRFRACVDQANDLLLASEDGDVHNEILFGYGGRVSMGRALLHSRSAGTEVEQLAIYDSVETDYQAGTHAEVVHWKRTGRRTEIFAFKRDRSPAVQHSETTHQEALGLPRREIRCLLFADLKGFSGLRERQLGQFQEQIMRGLAQAIGRCASEHGRQHPGEGVLERNTWGDAIYLVVSGARLGARCALALHEALDEAVAQLDFETDLQLRIGGHVGPVYHGRDHVRDMDDVYFGSHVTRAARVEPITLPGEVFVTSAFASQLSIEGGDDEFACEYVGRMALAKGYASDFPLYLLRRRP